MRQYVQTDLEVQRQVATTLAELIIGGVVSVPLVAEAGDSVHKSVHTRHEVSPGASAPRP